MMGRAIMKHVMAVLMAAAFAPLIWAADVSKVQPARVGRNPIVRVVTVSQAELRGGNGELLEDTMARLQQAAAFRPDIACLPELFSRRAPESVPGPVTERLSAWAREQSSYVVFGLKTVAGGEGYNSATLVYRAVRSVRQSQ